MATAFLKKNSLPLRGRITLPGDKSISHRRALLSLYTSETVALENFGSGEDCATTLNCLIQLGKEVQHVANNVTIRGEFSAQRAELDCGNSGTTARLLMGILAGRPGAWKLVGDESLSRRPMERVAAPLRLMGARIELEHGHLPALIQGTELTGIDYDSPVNSAQVKSAVLLAGARVRGRTRYREKIVTRDHTERLLRLHRADDGWINASLGELPSGASALSGTIPGDPSSAMFWIVAAIAVKESYLIFEDLLLNPLRLEALALLRVCGARIDPNFNSTLCGEQCGFLQVTASELNALNVTSQMAPALIDEIPALAVLATQCTGLSEFKGIGELRIKESDRIRLIVDNLARMGATVREWEDGFAVQGPVALHGAEIECAGDHRIAMAFGVAGLLADGKTRVAGCECAGVSYPEFWHELQQHTAPGTIELHE